MVRILTILFINLFLFSEMVSQEEYSPIDQYAIDFVKELRQKRDINQQDIADILGLSRSFVKSVENGYNKAKYNLRHINALADYFGISPREFLPEKAFPVDTPPVEKVVKKKAPVKKAAIKNIKNRPAPKRAAKK